MADEGITILGPDALPEEWLARIKPELAPGERLIWAGEARPPRGMSGWAVATIWAAGFAGIAMFGFAGLFGALGSTVASADKLLATIGVGASAIAFLIGIGMIAAGVGKAADRTVMSRNLYALTDSRAISWRPGGGGVTVVTAQRGTVKAVHRVEYPDGSGSVFFNTPATSFGAPAGFFDVADARRVEALVRLHLIADPSSP